jgi:hypothetical protein
MTTYALWRKEGEQFTDGNDPPRVLDGGTLYYYAETTLDPLTVYKNAHDAGATPWGTSVPLDSAGKLTDAIFVAEGNFKEVLKDAAGATVFERDRYPGSPPAPADPDAARPLTPIEPGSAATLMLDADDVGKVIDADDTGNDITVVLPDPGDVDNGEWIGVRKLSASNAVTIDDTYTEETWVLNRRYDTIVLVSNGVDAWNLLVLGRPQLLLNAQADKLLALAAAPGADRILFWDHSALAWAYLEVAAPLNLSGTSLGIDAASDTAAGKIEIATQPEMETPASALLAVPPARQHFHPGHLKAWANVAHGTTALTADYGIASVADNGAGDCTLTFDTAFSSANAYGPAGGWARGDGTQEDLYCHVAQAGAKTTTTFQAQARDASGGSLRDSPEMCISFVGDL